MAFSDDLQVFIENRLKAYDATIDLSPGSPAEIKIVNPIVTKLGEDPFATDISLFIRDRMVQEYPELAADNAGLLEDMFTNPLQMLLEPFKREVLRVRNNQSLANLDTMADTEADSLAANWFINRNTGTVVTGTVRIYFAAPNTTRISTDMVLTSASGLNFFPSQNYTINSTQMIFNREGNLYYMDIVVQAENAGSAYNVAVGGINNIDNVPGVVKVANLYRFQGGLDGQTNQDFISNLEQSLSERSLVTKRGATTQITQLYSDVRAMQVLGAGEVGMDRDILKGTGEGALFLLGLAAAYNNWVFLSSIIYRDAGPGGTRTLQSGDTIRYQPVPTWPTFPDVITEPIQEAVVVAVTPTLPGNPEGYLLILDRALTLASDGYQGQLAVLKPGYITISGVPGGMATDVTVPDGQVHLGGHVDVFIRPTSDDEAQTPLQNVTDDQPLVAATNFIVPLIYVGKNVVTTEAVSPEPHIDFLVAGVKAGDVLVLETGTDFAGTYHILAVTQYLLYVDAIFTSSTAGDHLRGRIVRNIHVDLIEPKQVKLPFGVFAADDLQTVVGSTLFKFPNVSLQDFGVAVGDTIRILSGPDAGDFTIASFDPGGIGAVTTIAASSTGSNLQYQIFTKYSGVTLPLVRLKGFEVLDSTGQGTGITVPYGDVVDVRPAIGMEGAGDVYKVYSKSLIVWPACYTNYGAPSYGTPDLHHDTRYSQKIETADGVVKLLYFDSSNQITQAEVNIPRFVYNGKADTLLVLANEPDYEFTPITDHVHYTSPIAKAKIGDSITILDGPNQGNYVIRDLRVMDLWSAQVSPPGPTIPGHHRVCWVQVDPVLPVDTISMVIHFLDVFHQYTPTISDLINYGLGYSSYWFHPSAYWEHVLVYWMYEALHPILGLLRGDIDRLLQAQGMSGYHTGPSSQGNMRLYFLNPVSVELNFGDDPTTFQSIENPEQSFRLDPTMDPSQIFPEAATPTPPQQWLRDSLRSLSSTSYLAQNGSTAYSLQGVRAGDLIEYYPEANCVLARGNMVSSFLCCTQAGTNIVQVILPGQDFNSLIVNAGAIAPGMPFFLDSGPDAGAYTITSVLDQYTNPVTGLAYARFRLDRSLSSSTLGFPADAYASGVASYSTFEAATARGGTSKLYAATRTPGPDTAFDGIPAGRWVTLYAAIGDTPADPVYSYGYDLSYLGSFSITQSATVETDGSAFNGLTYLTLDRGGTDFPNDGAVTNPYGDLQVLWIIHNGPADLPLATENGGTLISNQFVRWRMYAQLPVQSILSIPWGVVPNPITTATPHAFVEQLQMGVALPTFGHKMPYRIIRPGVFRQSSTAMSKNREGALYYLDVPAVSLGPGTGMNITEDVALEIAGTYEISGYTLEVDNPSLTYSMQEKLSVYLPSAVLPVGSAPSLNNEIRLAGQTLQVTYNDCPLVAEIQGMFDSPLDRVLISNALVRHFLPTYVFLDVAYQGGSSTELVAGDITKFINSISPDFTQLPSDAIVEILKQRGATKVTLPIMLVALVHGIDRKIRGIRSENYIGDPSIPTFAGTFTQAYFIPGPDTSTESPRPDGEQIFLTRG